MDTSRYDYHLPKELIAKYPLVRGTERLLVVEKDSGQITHLMFEDLLSFFRQGDVLVLNDTRVIPARLMGRKESGGKAEVLLLRNIGITNWRCLIRTSKKPKIGSKLLFSGDLAAVVEERVGDEYIVSFSHPDQVLKEGLMPLPPYLEREPEVTDAHTYQTVYARHDGSVASPTAGLHFTEESLGAIRSADVDLVYVTLHVGLGTFTPIRTPTVEEHVMHSEEYAVTEQTARSINEAMSQGRRIVAVGTTTVRVLEHLMGVNGRIVAGSGTTNLFICEGYRFKCVGALLTNFHLPCSTLLMLVSTFGGYEPVMRAYREAIERRYRFFSYGDAMLVI